MSARLSCGSCTVLLTQPPPSSIPLCAVSVKGKLPGNIDIVVRLFANNDSGYLYDLFLELFEQCQSTTINLRIFGLDKVGSDKTRGFAYTYVWGFSTSPSTLSIESMSWDLDSVTSGLETRGRSYCKPESRVFFSLRGGLNRPAQGELTWGWHAES